MRARISKTIVALMSCAVLVCGQEQTALVPPVRQFRIPARVGVFSEAQISLQQAIAMALANNNDIDASKIDRELADYTLTAARGVFDPVVGAAGQFQKQVVPVSSSLGGSTTGAVLNRSWQAQPTLNGSMPWYGGTYHLDFNNQQTSTNNSFATLNPQYPTSLTFQYTQPLMRNLMYDSNRHTIDVARKNRLLSQEQFRQRVMQVVQQTEAAYWEVVFAFNNLQVQLEAVDIARQQDESNRRQQEQGLLAPIDVVAAQNQLAAFEVNAYLAQNALTRAENTLKTLILADRAASLWASALIPTTPPDREPPATSLNDAVKEALTSRPEAAQVEITQRINNDDSRYFRDQTKPQVDLVGAYSRAGLAGTELLQTGGSPFTASLAPLFTRVNELSVLNGLDPITGSGGGTGAVVPPLLVGNYGQSLSTLWAGNFPTTTVQLRISLPIRNRTAEANLGRSIATGRRLQNQKDQTDQAIEADVRNSMQAMQSAQMRLDAARLQRQSAEEQYNSEQRQFRAGTSTLFLVQQRQSSMITARSQERRAESDLGQAISAFELATGSNLRAHNINLQ
jgi:outer membrane protein TolC